MSLRSWGRFRAAHRHNHKGVPRQKHFIHTILNDSISKTAPSSSSVLSCHLYMRTRSHRLAGRFHWALMCESVSACEWNSYRWPLRLRTEETQPLSPAPSVHPRGRHQWLESSVGEITGLLAQRHMTSSNLTTAFDLKTSCSAFYDFLNKNTVLQPVHSFPCSSFLHSTYSLSQYPITTPPLISIWPTPLLKTPPSKSQNHYVSLSLSLRDKCSDTIISCITAVSLSAELTCSTKGNHSNYNSQNTTGAAKGRRARDELNRNWTDIFKQENCFEDDGKKNAIGRL